MWGLRVVAHATELWWCGRVAALGTCWAAGVAGDGRGGLEAVELRGGVHLRRLLVDLGLWAVHVAVGDGTRGARAWVLLVEGIRVDEGAVAGLRLRAVVEYPDNLGLLVRVLEQGAGCTDANHGQKNVAGSGGLEGSNRRVDKGVDRRGSENESRAEETDNLLKSASASRCGGSRNSPRRGRSSQPQRPLLR
jgi:hypothetical protein